MKKIFWTLLGMSWILFLTSAQAAEREGCRVKEEKLVERLAIARAANNTHQIAGLERALEALRRNCSESALQSKNDLSIREKEQKVSERERELEEARRKGDTKKRAKKEKKLHQARIELEEARTRQEALQ